MGLEKELLGFYLTEHPLSSMLSLLSSEVETKIGELDFTEMSPGQQVRVGGVLSSLRIVMTKKSNSEMAFASLEDETGKTELVIFPKVFSAYKDIWVKDKIVVIDGKLEARDEGFTILVDSGQLLADMEGGKNYDFVIRVPAGTSPKILMALNSLLRESPGEKMGLLIFVNNGGGKKLELGFGVDYNKGLEEEIKELLKKQA